MMQVMKLDGKKMSVNGMGKDPTMSPRGWWHEIADIMEKAGVSPDISTSTNHWSLNIRYSEGRHTRTPSIAPIGLEPIGQDLAIVSI